MTLPNDLLARLKVRGLHVAGPWQEGEYGWLGRYTVAKGQWEVEEDIRVLEGPILWIYEEDGFWIAQKHEMIPGPGPTDFRCKYAAAEEAIDRVLRFFGTQENIEGVGNPDVR
jgi:hypothetical protein